jgi:predicted transcriptional regulator/predicted nucleotidyltransferase
MYIDPKSKIANRPAMEIRDMLHAIVMDVSDAETIRYHLKTNMQQTQKIIKILIAEGYLEIYPNHSGNKEKYRVTLKGGSLSLASAATPIKRSTADLKLKEFMERVQIVNSDDHYLFRVKKVIVFGSYLSDKDRINDIDFAVELLPKYDQEETLRRGQDQIEEARKRGRYFRIPESASEMLYLEDRVVKYLKSRSRSISIHSVDDELFKVGDVLQKLLYEETDAD